jgi:hypothetical protein
MYLYVLCKVYKVVQYTDYKCTWLYSMQDITVHVGTQQMFLANKQLRLIKYNLVRYYK